MKKTIISLTERQMEALGNESKRLGISKSELIRRFLDKQLDGKGEILDSSEKNVPESNIV
jgi:hypothetical protein